MDRIKDEWYQTYLATQFPHDLRRYDLTDLQPSDLDDLKQDLFLWYAEEIHGVGHYTGVAKRNYLKATDKQAYFNKMLARRVLNWAIHRSKESKMVHMKYAMELANEVKGKFNINAPCFEGLTLRSKVLVILRFAVNLTVKEIAQITRSSEQAVQRTIHRATEVINDNVTHVK